jgi:5-methylcytosine-specific restriction endonuclease McrA
MRSAYQLVDFLTDTMLMTDIYQPTVILHLLARGGTASKQDLARTLSGYDQSVQEYYEKVLMHWPKATLTKHGVVSYDRKAKEFSLAFDLADEAVVVKAKSICERKIAEWIQKKAERDPSGGVDASTRYRVLKAARGCCELCGISSKLSPIDIDHIVPRNHADKHGFVVKDGIRMPLDDERNRRRFASAATGQNAIRTRPTSGFPNTNWYGTKSRTSSRLPAGRRSPGHSRGES